MPSAPRGMFWGTLAKVNGLELGIKVKSARGGESFVIMGRGKLIRQGMFFIRIQTRTRVFESILIRKADPWYGLSTEPGTLRGNFSVSARAQ